jgi:hypothetical protein
LDSKAETKKVAKARDKKMTQAFELKSLDFSKVHLQIVICWDGGKPSYLFIATVVVLDAHKTINLVPH